MSFPLNQIDYLKMAISNCTIWNIRQTVLELKIMNKVIDPNCNTMNDDTSTALTSIFSEPPTNSSDIGLTNLKAHCSWLISFIVKSLEPINQATIIDRCKNILYDFDGLQKLKSPQSFLNLIISSLSYQTDATKVQLVESLTEQLNQMIKNITQNPSVTSSRQKNESKQDLEAKSKEYRVKIIETLPLRLSLIGGLLDSIIKNQPLFNTVSKLLISLISTGLVSCDSYDVSDDDLFYTCFDILAVLLWNCLGGDAAELYQSQIRTKDYNSLMRSMRKEIGDRITSSLELFRSLGPVPRVYEEIITYLKCI